MPPWGWPFFWGSVAAVSLLLGALVALKWPLGYVMAFGAGTLLSAVAIALAQLE